MTGDADPDALDRWERVQAIFGEALDLEAHARSDFLGRRCGEDSDLRAEVESLLEASEESDAYFGDLADRAGITLSPEVERDADVSDEDRATDPLPGLIGRTVGQYRVLEWLGRGGMASVYLAERRGEGFLQRVALKLVPRPVSDAEVQRRTAEERRILARLEHRNIARLIDGGITEEGYPFYAMEYVDGTDLLSYCDRKRLGVKERLELFLEVCAPVQFAHERLVVHCDIKPRNIFVTEDGHVKLLDFGVARLVDPEAVGDDVTGLWFTPAYASPEQVRREPPGTASDVYSLGVLLYEVLTGHRPYRFPSRLPDDVVRTVGEVNPRPPSAVVTQPTERTRDGEVPAVTLASSRRSTPQGMRKRLKGDLDAIVMKALAKDPDRRYHTTEQLATDIRRHLEHRTLSAVPRTPGYRLSRFVRRNRGGVLAAGLVLATTIGGVTATLWQVARATEAAALAREEADKAELVASLMTDLFRLSDPTEVLGDTITARDLLDRGTERIRTEFGDQPVVQAELLSEVADVYRNLGLYRRAEALARQALELRLARLGDRDLAVSESLIQLGRILGDLGRQAEAIETLERAIATREPLVTFPDTALVRAQGALAWLVRSSQIHERASELFLTALEGERALDPNGPGAADMMFGLAATYHDSGMLDQADSLLRAALGDLDPEARPTPMAVGALRNVGMIRRVREQYRESVPILRAAVEMAERLYGSNHREVFDAKNELGMALWGTGEWEEAERVLRDAILASSSVLGPRHRTTAGLQEALAAILVDREQYEEAVVLYETALDEKVERHQHQDHPGVVASLVRVAEALAGAGRNEEARAYVGRARDMTLSLSSAPSVYTISMERTLGRVAMAEGDADAAESHFQEAVRLAEQLLNRPDHRYTLWAKRDYGIFLARVGRRDEGVELLRSVLDAQIANLGDPHPVVERTRSELLAAGEG
jgi:serine/threonine-protein kinase